MRFTEAFHTSFTGRPLKQRILRHTLIELVSGLRQLVSGLRQLISLLRRLVSDLVNVAKSSKYP